VCRTHTCYTGRVVIVCVAATGVLAHVQVLQHTAAEHAKNKLYDISAGFAHSNGVLESCHTQSHVQLVRTRTTCSCQSEFQRL
jgi:hypothetical protein